MLVKVPLTLVAATLLLFAACSPAGTVPPTGTPVSTQAATATPTTAAASPGASASAATAGCGMGATGSKTVTITGFAFSPASLSVPVGTTVTWTNQDPTTHTATADDGSFDCRPISGGQSLSFTFTKPGTYAYHCAIHPTMKATITVT